MNKELPLVNSRKLDKSLIEKTRLNQKFGVIMIFLLVFILTIVFSAILVSAADEICCEKTVSGAWCNDAPSNQCDNDYRTNPNSCEATTFCQTGYCFDSNEGICQAGSPKVKCEAEEGEWSRAYNINLCQEGCCFLGENTQYVTETRCQILAERIGFSEPRFDLALSERECRFFTQKEGACLINENSCRYTTDENCIKNLGGKFFEGKFCSDAGINLSYKKHANKICYNEDIYWVDDKGNREDLLKNCVDRKESCEINQQGDPYCKGLQCFDEENDKLRINGESWCRYDAYVGNFNNMFSADVVGSEHCKETCVNGEIEIKCSSYRGEICAEKVDNTTGISTAQLRQNFGAECFNIKKVSECLDHPDCRIQSINVDTYFKFDVCVPKYPVGFDFYSEDSGDNGEDACGLASLTCEVLWDRDSFLTGADDCKENCDCNSLEFKQQMNNLCISLGDCGGYVNYAGVITNSELPWICGNLGRYKTIFNFLGIHLEEICKSVESQKQSILEVLTKPNVLGVNTPQFLNRIFQKNRPIPDALNRINYADVRNVEMGGDDELRPVRYICAPWEPPAGGDDCEKCNENSLIPCTEYRCHSLGGACEIIPETKDSDNPICVDMYSEDSTVPQISFGEISSQYKVTNGANGVSIALANGQCPAKYSKVAFTLKTNEIAKCYTVANLTDILEGLGSERNYSTTHSREIRLNVDNKMRLYTICQDKAGNINENEFLVDICVSPEPDINPPVIEKFTPESGSFLKFGETESNLEIELNEPASCKYDTTPNVGYESMSFEMACNKLQINTLRHVCGVNLRDLTENENKIYIRCEDTSGNANTKDAEYILFATLEELKIDSTYPDNETIIKKPISRSDPLILEVKTSGGAYNGVSICEYRFLDQGWSDVFTETDSTIHKYSIFSNLSEGIYKIEFTCEDKAGNIATSLSEFEVEIDTAPPVVVRAFHDTGTNRLKLITNEEARCYYNNVEACSPFTLDNSRAMTTAFSTTHSAAWDESRTYYVKCEDLFGNKNPSCAIIVKPSQ